MRERFTLWIVVLSLLLSTGGVVRAHSHLISSKPAPGETVQGEITQISLTFDEAVGPGSRLSLVNSDFLPVGNPQTHVEQKELIADLDQRLQQGSYRVDWVAVSQDLDTAQGSFHFSVDGEDWIQSAGLWAVALIFLLAALASFIRLRSLRRSGATGSPETSA